YLSIKAKLQDAVNALNYGSLSVKDENEEEICSYRIKQTKSRKTIAINCRECDSGSSLNDVHCRKNIFRILQKEVKAAIIKGIDSILKFCLYTQIRPPFSQLTSEFIFKCIKYFRHIGK
ncbi:MAG TPA: hypothetical protein VHO68_01615, partial [Bacteroidales bacterium]|nr:hypothetical protein [Bacteroidales bacterium]